jgi:autotransporter-associated beta strand protein
LTISGTSAFNNTSGAALTLSSNPVQIWSSDFSFLGSNNLNLGAGPVLLSANRTVTVNAGVLQVDGTVSGAFSLTKAGAGTLVLNGNNTFTGPLALTGGTLILNKTTSGGGGTIAAGTGTTVAVGDSAVSNVFPSSLKHRWSFAEASGSVLRDSVGTADGTIVNPGGTQTATLGGGKLVLQGGASASASYAKMPGGLLQGLKDMTIEVWAAPNVLAGATNSRILLFSDAAGSGNFISITTIGPGTGSAYLYAPNFGISSAPTITSTAGQVYHYVLVWDSAAAQVRYYRDGVLVTSAALGATTLSQLADAVVRLLGRRRCDFCRRLSGGSPAQPRAVCVGNHRRHACRS